MKRIVICDDEPHMVEGIRFLLRNQDMSVRTACNGLEALEMIQAEVPDLLITDITMPEMDGLELVAALRKDEATKHLPIIILTARGQAQDAALAQEMWCASLIPKPFEPRNLKELVAAKLEGKECQAYG
jgi:CheY-like chemotaxis protein